MCETLKIFGPPGTGKTTYLMGLLEKELEYIPASKCAFMSFTRQGSYEGAGRAKMKLSLHPEDLKFFRTIHSLAYRTLGMKKDYIITPCHLKAFGEKIGFHFTGDFSGEAHTSQDDRYLFAESLYRANRQKFVDMALHLDTKKLKHIAANYRAFKKSQGLYDFTDVLELYLLHGDPLPCETAFIDEAQDLTPLQWQCVKKMTSECKKVFIAGDDDQAIYSWAGADVQAFLRLPGEVKILQKSRRVPQKVHAYAKKVCAMIKERQEKEWEGRQEVGEVEIVGHLSDVKLSPEDTILFLSRERRTTKVIAEHLQERAESFILHGKPSFSPRALKGIWAYEAWKDGDLSDEKLKKYEDLFAVFDKSLPWQRAIHLKKKDIFYYERLLAKGHKAFIAPKVTVSTIHASKGSEADHVILCLDTSSEVAKSLALGKDDEYRVLYVAVTRARKKLTLVLSQSAFSYPLFKETKR